MRLWHEELIPCLSNKRLSSQHRECCALRGNGWGRKHKTVDYVFKHAPAKLYDYHVAVMQEMQRRHFKVDEAWYSISYRGSHCKPWSSRVDLYHEQDKSSLRRFYPEHDEAYLLECLDILRRKGELLTVELDDEEYDYRTLCTENIKHCYQIHLQSVDEHTIIVWTTKGGPYGNQNRN